MVEINFSPDIPAVHRIWCIRDIRFFIHNFQKVVNLSILQFGYVFQEYLEKCFIYDIMTPFSKKTAGSGGTKALTCLKLIQGDDVTMGCNHDCESCGGSCGEPESLLKAPHPLSNIKKVIGVVSGKGGVGKSMCTSLLAIAMQRKGAHCGILDADITGPSIPKGFGLTGTLGATEEGVFPMATKTGIDVCSINLLLENAGDPVIWRGPIIAGAVQQFWTDIIWKDIDFMFVDMPPGTGDVPLTVFQSLPVDGIVVMTSPQELVSQVVTKAVKMAEMMEIPILGIIENYSYVQCPDCGKKISVFGESHVDEIAQAHNLDVLAKLPIDPALAAACDAGALEDVTLPDLSKACDKLAAL